MIKVLHVADLHLGVTVHGGPGRPRLAEFLGALDRACDVAEEADVDIILVAGDVFNGNQPTPEVEREWAARVSRLIEKGVPMAVVLGNHDVPARRAAASHMEVYDRLPLDSVHVFTIPDVKRIETRAGVLQVAGVGWPFRGRFFGDGSEIPRDTDVADVLENLVDGFILPRLDARAPAVLLAHLWLREGTLSSEKTYIVGPDPIIPASSVVRDEFAYFALGHLHRHQVVPGTDGRVVYAGGLCRIDFSDEDVPKGVVLAEVSSGSSSWRFVEIPARVFKTVTVEVGSAAETGDRIRAAVDFDTAEAAVRLRLRGPAAALQEVRKRDFSEFFPGAFAFKVEPEPTDERRRPRPAIAEDAKITDALKRYIAENTLPGGLTEAEVIRAAAELQRRVEEGNAF